MHLPKSYKALKHGYLYINNNNNIAVGHNATKTATNEAAAWAGFW